MISDGEAEQIDRILQSKKLVLTLPEGRLNSAKASYGDLVEEIFQILINADASRQNCIENLLKTELVQAEGDEYLKLSEHERTVTFTSTIISEAGVLSDSRLMLKFGS